MNTRIEEIKSKKEKESKKACVTNCYAPDQCE